MVALGQFRVHRDFFEASSAGQQRTGWHDNDLVFASRSRIWIRRIQFGPGLLDLSGRYG